MVNAPDKTPDEMGPAQKSIQLALRAKELLGGAGEEFLRQVANEKEFLRQVGLASPVFMTYFSTDPNFERFLEKGLYKYFLDPTDEEARANLAPVIRGSNTPLASRIMLTMTYFHNLAQINPAAAKCFAYAVLLQHPTMAAAAEQTFGPIENVQ